MSATQKAEPPGAVPKAPHLKNIALFLASPFIGLVYAVLLPGKLFQLAKRDMQQAKSKHSAEG